jgi:hypothetical protein
MKPRRFTIRRRVSEPFDFGKAYYTVSQLYYTVDERKAHPSQPWVFSNYQYLVEKVCD